MRSALLFSLLVVHLFIAPLPRTSATEAANIATAILQEDDKAFLSDLEERSFHYFWDTAHPKTGLIPDRTRVDGSRSNGLASIAAVGFGLTAYCIGAERGWITREQAQSRIEATLSFLLERAPQEHGFLPHFLNLENGQRAGRSEYSSIDTALLLHGALAARQYFAGTPVETLATRLYERVDWPWMTDGRETLAHAWTPEKGFTPHHWQQFSEHLGMTLLAIASPTHPLPVSAWNAWQRRLYAAWGPQQIRFLHYPPLFVHQFPQAWWDLRDWQDREVNYFENSRRATLAQRDFCVSLRDRFPSFEPNVWGLTASDSSSGYKDWGGPPVEGRKPDPRIDGTVVPCAPAGSLPFAPRECLDALKTMRTRFGDRIYGRFGFADAFHPMSGWTNSDVLGIDVGITLLMAENLQTGFVWRWFMKNPEVARVLPAIGLRRQAKN